MSIYKQNIEDTREFMPGYTCEQKLTLEIK